jgi:hypothetical protein
MWWTSEGERVLRGAEWELFREGLAGVWDQIEDSKEDDEDSFTYGIPAFDNLQTNQKLALLALVGKALHDEAIPMPNLTAHAEATVATIFKYVRQSVEIEIGLDEGDDPDATFWRQLVLAACREVEENWEKPLPDPCCDDVGEWEVLIDVLAEWILWDYDFCMEESFLDEDPVVAKKKMKEMGIAGDYYLQPAPDPPEKDMEGIRATLREITRRP